MLKEDFRENSEKENFINLIRTLLLSLQEQRKEKRAFNIPQVKFSFTLYYDYFKSNYLGGQTNHYFKSNYLSGQTNQ